MSSQFLIEILLAFASGGGLSWLIFKYRIALNSGNLENQLANTQTHNAELNTQIINLSDDNTRWKNKFDELNVENTRISTLLSESEKSFAGQKTEIEKINTAFKTSQDENTRILQLKARSDTDLDNANRANAELKLASQKNLQEIKELNEKIATYREQNSTIVVQSAEKDKRLQEQQKFIDEANKNLKDVFTALSSEALKSNNTSFVTLAKETLETQIKEAKGDLEKKENAIQGIVKPLSDSLKSMDTKINELEGKRIAAYRDIWNYLDQVKLTTEGLKKETNNLVGALKTSHSRGRYGEIALRRVVEYAGMIDHCHFQEQVSVEDESGRLRPDMIIFLPDNKRLVVDSKVPLSAYLRMFETQDVDQQSSLLNQHTNAVRDHLKKLSAKSYWQQFDEAPDFVIMYTHIESSFGAALQSYPELIDEAIKSRVIIASPTILISILMSIGYSWNQIKTIENIEEIRTAAVELYERSTVFVSHIVSVGDSLENTVKHYNNAVGSLEGNFMPQARKINTLSQAYTKKILKDLEPIELSSRKVTVTLPSINIEERNGEDAIANSPNL